MRFGSSALRVLRQSLYDVDTDTTESKRKNPRKKATVLAAEPMEEVVESGVVGVDETAASSAGGGMDSLAIAAPPPTAASALNGGPAYQKSAATGPPSPVDAPHTPPLGSGGSSASPSPQSQRSGGVFGRSVEQLWADARKAKEKYSAAMQKWVEAPEGKKADMLYVMEELKAEVAKAEAQAERAESKAAAKAERAKAKEEAKAERETAEAKAKEELAKAEAKLAEAKEEREVAKSERAKAEEEHGRDSDKYKEADAEVKRLTTFITAQDNIIIALANASLPPAAPAPGAPAVLVLIVVYFHFDVPPASGAFGCMLFLQTDEYIFLGGFHLIHGILTLVGFLRSIHPSVFASFSSITVRGR